MEKEKYQEIEVPKGMSFTTLQIILEYMNKKNEYETIEKISEETSLAYQTVHRYLNFLSKNKYIKKELNYGNVGRPIHKYKIS